MSSHRPTISKAVMAARIPCVGPGDRGQLERTKAVALTLSKYTFEGGYPAAETVERAYDDADLNRAVTAYRFFYPTVSGMAIFKGNADVGVEFNSVFGTLDTKPRHVGFTLNSD
jgi:hypothetical protein